MKKLIFLLMLIVAIPLLGFSQSGIFHKAITVTLAGSDTAEVWQAFLSNRWTTDLSSTLVDPSDEGGFLGNFTAYIYIDSVKATAPTADSLAWGIVRTDHDGIAIGDTLWHVANADVFLSGSLSYARTYNAFRIHNRVVGFAANNATWIDLRGEFEDWLGVKHIFMLHDYAVACSLEVTLHTNQMR